MSFRKEPAFQHGNPTRTAVVLVNLGTPDAPTGAALRRYLKQFLSDPRVVEIPRPVWWLILHAIILPFRSGKSAKKYASIWTRDGSPLRVHTQKQALLLKGLLGERSHQDVQVVHAMRYGEPSLPAVLDKLKEEACERILILPAYPQYCAATTASIYDAVFEHYRQVRNVPELRFVKHFHDNPDYIDALTQSVLSYWAAHGKGEKLVMSFHGIPKRSLLQGDPYHCECYKTARLLAAQLRLTPDQYLVSFQSRFGRAEWLQPYTSPSLQKMAAQGVKRVDVICPGFVSDCLETLEEIAMEVKQEFLQAGGKEFHYIPCLNENPAWIKALAEVTEQHMIGWPTMLPQTQRDAQKKDAEIAKQAALMLGAKQ